MGSGFDEMTPASHPALHAEHLASGVLSTAQVAERDCLLAALQHGGFSGIPTSGGTSTTATASTCAAN
jgi:D-alanyl-D-alanine dipeptidase